MAFHGQVAQLLAGIDIGHDGTDRDGHVDVLASVTGAIVAAAALAILTPIGARNPKVRQRIHALDRFEVHAAAQPPVAAIGTAEGNEFLAPKADAAAPAVAGLHLQFGFVDEFHERDPKKLKRGTGIALPPFVIDRRAFRLACAVRLFGDDVHVGVLVRVP